MKTSILDMAGILKKILRKIFKLFFFLFALSLIVVFSLKFFNPPIWMWKIQRELNSPPGYPEQTVHTWVSSNNINSEMKLAVIASEDQHFPSHWGFDVESIKQAYNDIQEGKRFRGASTISQQTAKNLFLWPSQNIFRKGLEAYFTILLELMLTKERILEIYLNIIEYGPGIYGVEEASKRFFGKSASELNKTQAARLAAVLPNPYTIQANKNTPYIQERVKWIKQQMTQLGLQTVEKIH